MFNLGDKTVVNVEKSLLKLKLVATSRLLEYKELRRRILRS